MDALYLQRLGTTVEQLKFSNNQPPQKDLCFNSSHTIYTSVWINTLSKDPLTTTPKAHVDSFFLISALGRTASLLQEKKWCSWIGCFANGS